MEKKMRNGFKILALAGSVFLIDAANLNAQMAANPGTIYTNSNQVYFSQSMPTFQGMVGHQSGATPCGQISTYSGIASSTGSCGCAMEVAPQCVEVKKKHHRCFLRRMSKSECR
jgi:hypothetical protein